MDYKELRSRLVIISLTPRQILEIIKQHYQFTSGLKYPGDMTHAGGNYDFDRAAFQLKVMSTTFSKVKEGERIPYNNVELK